MADQITSKQSRYRRLPRIIRYPLVGIAFLMLPAGIIAMFTPLAVLEIGSLLIFASLSILSLEFNWAQSLLHTLRIKLRDKKIRRRLTIFTVAIIVIYAAIFVFRLFTR